MVSCFLNFVKKTTKKQQEQQTALVPHGFQFPVRVLKYPITTFVLKQKPYPSSSLHPRPLSPSPLKKCWYFFPISKNVSHTYTHIHLIDAWIPFFCLWVSVSQDHLEDENMPYFLIATFILTKKKKIKSIQKTRRGNAPGNHIHHIVTSPSLHNGQSQKFGMLPTIETLNESKSFKQY